ncbi:hypothetical protein GGP41_003265 [Bipolaris sorokiniana]|uniref:Uncharacterized protein n=1 Tax=Cochliobolus sativus TaxID=45130 RepID=A0A8H5ZEV9_COCSA|nr:hypothetical protein GGP41_003265 [Bipolaris sorokiniana]
MGADVNAQSEQYNSALQAASFRGYDQVVRLILDADADVNAWSEQYSSAFYASYQEAEMRHRLALEVQKKVLGHEYPYILMDMYKLASVLECRCKYEEAEEMYRRVVKRQEKMLGRTKQATLSSVSSLGFMLRKQSKNAPKSSEGLEKVLVLESTDTLDNMSDLGFVLLGQGK